MLKKMNLFVTEREMIHLMTVHPVKDFRRLHENVCTENCLDLIVKKKEKTC